MICLLGFSTKTSSESITLSSSCQKANWSLPIVKEMKPFGSNVFLKQDRAVEKPTCDLDRVLSRERLSISEYDIVLGIVYLVDMKDISHPKKDANMKDIILQLRPSSKLTIPSFG